MASPPEKNKSLESWIWDAACSIRGAKDAAKYSRAERDRLPKAARRADAGASVNDYILPLIFTKRLCDVFDDELNRIAKEVDLDDDFLSNFIEAISTKRLGLEDVEANIIGKSYEPSGARQTARQGSPKGERESANQYLIRKFAEGSGQSAGEFYTPPEVGTITSRVLAPEPGMTVYDPTCGSGGLLVKLETAMEEREGGHSCPPGLGKGAQECPPSAKPAPLKLFGQEYVPETWAMANMNMIIHDMEGQIEIGDTFRNPKLRDSTMLRTFDRVAVTAQRGSAVPRAKPLLGAFRALYISGHSI